MNPVIAGLIGAAIMYVVSVIITLIDEYWIDEIYCTPLNALFCILTVIPLFFYGFFRNVVTPVTKERQEDKFIKEMIKDSHRLTNYIYFHHDKKATRFFNKNFLFRLEK